MSGDSTANLVRMVNQIARNVTHEADPVATVADHVAAFWSGRMRAQIATWLDQHGGEGLDPVALAALQRLQQGADAG
ncbi:formate dehydrogenase subunit delta [Novosphingobium sp. FKTRR1]|uniref:formate dehydrogenase subunit delta n=1 Tax=Novosphingobium sp. FKTRR1 TaxID=2879118 RepID=UPI001CEFE78F|nr:formate dehydrogenase subunit delta [Novosphingobium sp. FKTRR1]